MRKILILACSLLVVSFSETKSLAAGNYFSSNLEEVQQAFTEAPNNINTKDSNGYTPLANAAFDGNLNIVKYLIDNGANVNTKNDSGDTPLISAVLSDDFSVVKYLIDKGADVNAKDSKGISILNEAARLISRDVEKYLVENGANVNTKNESGIAPLNLHAYSGNLQLVKYYVEHGADKETKDANGYTPLNNAIRNGNLDVVKYLIGMGAKKTDLLDFDGKTAAFIKAHPELGLSIKGQAAASSTNNASGVISISGIIKDSETGEGVALANVYSEANKSIGTAADNNGKFTINNFPAGSKVVISHVGYKTLTLSSDSVAEVKLEVNTLEEVSIIIKAGDPCTEGSLMTNASAGKREKNKDGGLPCVPTACVDGYKLESGKCIESQAEEKPENTENPGKPETIETPQPAGSECDKKTAGYEIFEGNCITTAQKAQIERQREEERKQQAKNALQSQISNHAATISGIKTAHSGEKASVWKNNEGKFNTTRLLSDSIAGVALGTVGGLVVNKVVKKNQLESGFEDIGCHIGSERVADFDDQFEVDGALDRAGCLAYNSGRGNVYVWASKSSVGTNYSGMVEDAQNPDNNGCYVRIDIKSDNAKISVADIQPRWFMVGQGITCGSWTNKDALRDRILKSKKSARTWATIGGAVGGAGVGVGAMELFGNKLIGGKVQGQKSLSEEDLLYSQMSESERAQYQAANNELRRLCTELKSAGGSAAECN